MNTLTQNLTPEPARDAGPDCAPVSGSSCIEVALAKIEAAQQMVHALCQPKGTAGAREWIMSIPARPDYDPDLVISAALAKAKVEILALTRQVKALQETVDGYEEQWVDDNV